MDRLDRLDGLKNVSLSPISNRSSPCSIKSFNRFDLGISKNKGMFPKFSGKGNVMKRMRLFENLDPEEGRQNRFREVLKPQNVNQLCEQIAVQNNRNKLESHSFHFYWRYAQILPQIADWNHHKVMLLGNHTGFCFNNMRNFKKQVEITENWQTRCVKFKDEEVFAIGSYTGHVMIYDSISLSKISTIVEKNKCKHLKSLIWDKNLILKGSEQFLNGKDILAKTNNVITLPHAKSGICTMSLNDKMLAVGYQQGDLLIYDLRMQSVIEDIDISDQSSNIFVQWCPWRKDILIAAQNKLLCQISGLSYKVIRKQSIQSHLTGMTCLPFTQQIVTSSETSFPRLRNRDLQQICQLDGVGLPTSINCLGSLPSLNKVHAITIRKRGYVWDIPMKEERRCRSVLEDQRNWMFR